MSIKPPIGQLDVTRNDPNRYSPSREMDSPSRQTSTEREQQADRTGADERYDSDNDRGMNPDMDRPNLRTNTTISNLSEGYGNAGSADDDAHIGGGSRQQSIDQDDDSLGSPSRQGNTGDTGLGSGQSMGREGSRGGYGSGEEAGMD